MEVEAPRQRVREPILTDTRLLEELTAVRLGGEVESVPVNLLIEWAVLDGIANAITRDIWHYNHPTIYITVSKPYRDNIRNPKQNARKRRLNVTE